MSPKGLRVEFSVPQPHKRREESPAAPVNDPVPRIARLLALAHKWEGMVRRGEAKDYAEIARRMGLSRARVTQICGLALLAPEFQEQILIPDFDASSPSPRRIRRASTLALWNQQAI